MRVFIHIDMATGGEPPIQLSIEVASDDCSDTDWCRQCDIRGSKIVYYCVDHSSVFCVKCKYTKHRYVFRLLIH